MSYKKALSFMFITFAVVSQVFFGFISFVGFVIQVILIASISSAVVFLIQKKDSKKYKTLFLNSVIVVSTLFGVLTALVGVFVSYHILFPAKLYDIKLSNGSGSIVYLEMSHIATDEFYRQKNTTIRSLVDEGYIVLVEGVTPGTDEEQAIFDQAIGFRFTPTLYSELAKIGGLVHQDDAVLYRGIATGSLLHLDLSLADIVSELGTMTGSSPAVVDIEKELLQSIGSLSRGERIFLHYGMRALLNWSLKNTAGIESQLLAGDRGELFQVIIEKRNKPIIEYIQQHPDAKVVIVYGALHFNGIYSTLQTLEYPWQIDSSVAHTPYR